MTELVANKTVIVDELQYEYSKKIAIYFVLFLLLYETSAYIANDMIMPGMIDVVHSFKADDKWVSASLSAFILGGGSLQLFLGPLSDHFGRRPVMIAGVAFFLLCTIIIAISQSIHEFIAARFFQGMGLCFISVIGYATLQEIFSEMYAIRIISLMSNITILAPLLGPLIGALIIMTFSWRVVFYIIALFTFLALLGLWFYMPETVGVMKKDGSTISSTSLHPRIIKNNYSALIKNKRFMMGSLSIGIATIPIISWIGLSPLILMKSAKLSLMQYALYQIPIFLTAIVGNITMRYWLPKIALPRIVTAGSIIMFLSLFVTPLLVYFIYPSYVPIIISMCIYAFGLGFTTAPLNRLTLFSTLVPKGTASAMMSVLLMFLCALGNQTANWFYYNESNIKFAFFCLMCSLVYCLFYRGFCRESASNYVSDL